MYFFFAYILTYAFWISIAATEGWKWRQDIHGNDNSKVINYRSYHVWRLVTNVVPFLLCINGLFLMDTHIGWLGLTLWLLLINISGNAAYELMMSYVQEDRWFIDRGNFHIMGISIKRPSPYIGAYVGVFAFIVSVAFILLK